MKTTGMNQSQDKVINGDVISRITARDRFSVRGR